MSEFKGKVAIITGASSGIGQATAILFAKHGAKVAIVARNKDKLASTEKQCAAAGSADNVLVINADVGNLADLKRIVDETAQKFKQIDFLVNNAGSSHPQSLLSTTPEVFEQMINVNARAPFFLMQYSTPYLEKTKGSVINISSVGSLRGQPMYTVYQMAKAALDQLTRAAACELASKGIRVNTINPGLIESDLATSSGATPEQFQAFAQHYASIVPVRRHGLPIDIAECILFLASNKSGFLDGINLVADGGRTAIL